MFLLLLILLEANYQENFQHKLSKCLISRYGLSKTSGGIFAFTQINQKSKFDLLLAKAFNLKAGRLTGAFEVPFSMQKSVEELKQNGSNIPVTSSNRIEYIYLVADYKLNKQIRLQCNAFRQGLANAIDIEWLQTFSYRELQVLVSSAYTPVDLEDPKQHTHYTGGYFSTHPVIQGF
ncbi:hypothetical protein DAPPUDRAFT_325874 [Daphnia pulex]|uniref:HECT-type E3 ubiquitin transferase n=1 Tax=Daphnia pulex TaxID=6669 RepID=E9H611_DAPPU|nr:hypothetical protein DAPPUDRAFT_325874 [Daphnia pulex]|eukprot:EFX72838.1 hypothetical protein DAPPUDRAFT_325874 [Daphnia pulex]